MGGCGLDYIKRAVAEDTPARGAGLGGGERMSVGRMRKWARHGESPAEPSDESCRARQVSFKVIIASPL